jgi:hypothetical protein
MVMTLQDLDRPADTSVIGMRSLVAKVRFAVLWLIAGCALAGSFVVFFAEPGRLEEGVAGVIEGHRVTEGMALQNAAMVALPLVMAAVVLFLPVRASAIANLVVGVPLGAFGLFAVVSELTEGGLPAHVTLAALAAAIAWLIVGLSVAALKRGAGRDAEGARAGHSAQGTG